MGQEAFDIEGCVQKENKRKGVMNMLRKTKRTLSLVLALIMICSTMGVMAFAAETSAECCFCETCKDEVACRKVEDWQFNRVIVCERHNEQHDAEEYYVHVAHKCPNCNSMLTDFYYDRKDYICLL